MALPVLDDSLLHIAVDNFFVEEFKHGTEVTFALLTHTELGSNPGSADIFLSHYWLVHG